MAIALALLQAERYAVLQADRPNAAAKADRPNAPAKADRPLIPPNPGG